MTLSQLSLLVICIASSILLSLCHFRSNLKIITISVEMLQISNNSVAIVDAKTISVILIERLLAHMSTSFLSSTLHPLFVLLMMTWRMEMNPSMSPLQKMTWFTNLPQLLLTISCCLLWMCCWCCCCSTTRVSPSILSCTSVTTWTGITLSHSYWMMCRSTSQWLNIWRHLSNPKQIN